MNSGVEVEGQLPTSCRQIRGVDSDPGGCTAVAPASTKKHRCQGNGRLLQGWHPSAGTLVPVGTPVWSVMGSLSLRFLFLTTSPCVSDSVCLSVSLLSLSLFLAISLFHSLWLSHSVSLSLCLCHM